MNLFLLSLSLKKAARKNVDSHVRKIILEATELLYSAWKILEKEKTWLYKTPGGRAYGRVYPHHPMSIWASQSKGNYLMLANFAMELCKEKMIRHPDGNQSANLGHIKWCLENVPPSLEGTSEEPTQLPQSIGQVEEKKDTSSYQHVQLANGSDDMYDTVLAYRQYYLAAKYRLFSYSNVDTPHWFTERESKKWKKLQPKKPQKVFSPDFDSLYKTTYAKK